METYMKTNLKGRLFLGYFAEFLSFALLLFILVRIFPDANVFTLSLISAAIIMALGGSIVVYLTNYQIVKNLDHIHTGVNTVSEEISSTAEGLAASTQEVNATTQQFSSTIQRMSQGGQDQAQSIDEIVNVMKDLLNSLDAVVKNAEATAAVSSKAAASTQEGGKAAEDSITRMGTITKVVDSSTDVVRKLKDSSTQIGVIVDVIINIAQQTNLLALNAAIEAARAGEHGKGFAVVADEVRKLAEGSKEAADRISKLVTDIGSDTANAVKIMEDGAKEVSEGSEIIGKALDSLQTIAISVTNTAEMVEKIKESTVEQKAFTEKVLKDIDSVSSVADASAASAEEMAASTQELTASMEEISATAQELFRISQDLKESVKAFAVYKKME